MDNATVWVNGKKVFERASDYPSILRLDRYRVPQWRGPSADA